MRRPNVRRDGRALWQKQNELFEIANTEQPSPHAIESLKLFYRFLTLLLTSQRGRGYKMTEWIFARAKQRLDDSRILFGDADRRLRCNFVRDDEEASSFPSRRPLLKFPIEPLALADPRALFLVAE